MGRGQKSIGPERRKTMEKATILNVSAAVVLLTRFCAGGEVAISSFDRQGRMLWSDPQSALTHYRLETAPSLAGPWMDRGMIIPGGDPLYLASLPMTETHGCSRVVGSWGVPAWNLEVVGRTGGDYFEIEVQGQYAYVLEAGGLSILDVSDPANPQVVGMAACGGLRRDGGYTGDLVVRGDYVYVTAGYSDSHQKGLRIFDIHTPSRPAQIGFFPFFDFAGGVALSGNYAYVGTSRYRVSSILHVVDITNPTRPIEVGSLSDSYNWNVSHLVVGGDHLYAGSKIIDISFPTLPLEVGSLPVSGNMEIEGNLIYVAAGSLEILDATDPANPIMVGGYAQAASSVAVQNNRAYVIGRETLRVFDVNTPSSLFEIAVYDEWGYGPRAVAVQGDFAYLAGEQGLRIFDVAAPYSGPVEVAYFEPKNTGVAIRDGLAYVSEPEYGLRILDLSVVGSQSALEEVGSCEFPGSFFGGDLEVRGNYACVLDGPRGLHIVDVGNPSAPAPLGFYPISSDLPSALGLSGNYAYVAADDAGLRIIDVSNPSVPVEVGSYNTSAFDVALSGNYAYVTGEQGFLVLDVSDSANPRQVALMSDQACTIPYVADRYAYVATDGNHAYVACYNTLQILNIGSPSNPIVVGGFSYSRLSKPSRFEDVAIREGRVYLPSRAGLLIVDVSNPAVPEVVSSYPFWGSGYYINNLVVSGDLAYIGTHNRGLRVIDVSNPTNSSSRVGAFVVPPAVGFGARWFEHEVGAIYGEYAYVAGHLGLRIVDLQDPAMPVVNTYRPLEDYPAIGSVKISGDHAYVTIGGEYQMSFAHGRGELRILNLTTPTHPTEVGSYVFPPAVGFSDKVSTLSAVSEEFAYLTTGTTREELRILDVSNPANPTRVGSYFTTSANEEIRQVVVQEGYAYLTTFGWNPTAMGWFRIIDVRNPASPSEVASVEFLYRTDMFVAVSGNHAYLSGSGEHALRVFDISNPADPTEVGNLYSNEGTLWSLTAFGSYVAMDIDITPAESSYTRGLRLVDVSDPTAPTEVGFMNIGGVSFSMDANRIYVIEPGTGASWVLDVLGM
jgi:hypothetical protein